MLFCDQNHQPTLEKEPPVIGHNSDNVQTTAPQSLTNASKEKLKQFVARIERLEDEKTELAGQLKEVYGEAKALGYDNKALRALIRLRKIPKGEREEAQMVLDLYCEAVGEI
jgi:uncharacterized protein (UPF0335 family)